MTRPQNNKPDRRPRLRHASRPATPDQHRRVRRKRTPVTGGTRRVRVREELIAGQDHASVTAVVVTHIPDPSYPDGLAALADALVLQMFDSGLGETLRIAYTTLQKDQERQSRHAQIVAATGGLRAYLARLDEHGEQP